MYSKDKIMQIGRMYISSKYMEPHRCYHGWFHIKTMLDEIDKADARYNNGKTGVGDRYNYLRIAALLHDFVYDPFKTDNEEASTKYISEYFPDLSKEEHDVVHKLIMCTSIPSYDDPGIAGNSILLGDSISEMRILDLISFMEKPHLLPDNFVKIMREYQRYNFPEFREGNLEVVNNFHELGYMSDETHSWYTKWIKMFRPKIGIYAGSFNPFHIGHMNVLEQAERVFDKVVIMSPDKGGEHYSKLRLTLPFHEVKIFSGMLIDAIKPYQKFSDITLVRGLRDGNDLSYEINMHNINIDLGMDVPTMYFITNLPHISSTVIRDLTKIDAHKNFIPTKYDYYTGSGSSPYLVIPPREAP